MILKTFFINDNGTYSPQSILIQKEFIKLPFNSQEKKEKRRNIELKKEKVILF